VLYESRGRQEHWINPIEKELKILEIKRNAVILRTLKKKFVPLRQN